MSPDRHFRARAVVLQLARKKAVQEFLSQNETKRKWVIALAFKQEKVYRKLIRKIGNLEEIVEGRNV